MRRSVGIFLALAFLSIATSCNVISSLFGGDESAPTVRISGTISVPGTVPPGGYIYVGILNTVPFQVLSAVTGWQKYQQLVIAPGADATYAFQDVNQGKYIIGAFLDLNSNLVYDEGEPSGAYPGPNGAILFDFSSDMSSANITLTYTGSGNGITDAEAVETDKSALAIGYASGDSASSVSQSLTLPITGANGSTIVWTSTNETLVKTTQVTLIATILKGSVSSSKLFNLIVLAGVATDAEAVAADKTALAVGFAAGDSETAVTSNLSLPTQGAGGSTIFWVSGNDSLISAQGLVTRPATATNVTLTAFLMKGGDSAQKTFTLTVLAATLTDAQAVAADAGALQPGYSAGDSATAVTGNLSLALVGANGSLISWSSSNAAVVSPAGIVTRPATDTTVTLTAAVIYGVASQAKQFVLTVLSASLTDAQAVAADKAALQIVYAPGDSAAGVTTTLGLPGSGTNGASITWQSSDDSIISVSGAVNRPASTSSVALTATITKGGVSDIKVFSLTVLQATLSDQAVVEADVNALAIGFASGDSASSVTAGLTLPTTGTNGSTIAWASSDSATVSNAGAVTRQDSNKSVTLTATVTKNETAATRTFSVVVIARVLSDAEIVAADKAALAIGFSAGDSETGVTGDLVLPLLGTKGSSISWVSSDSTVIDPDTGMVERPLDMSVTVTLTATLIKNSTSDAKIFTLIVLSRTMTDAESVAADKASLEIEFAIGNSATNVTSNLVLPVNGANGTSITWASSEQAIVSSAGFVTRPAVTATVTLTATIAKGMDSDTKPFDVIVIQAAPTTPTGLAAGDATTTSLFLSWSAVAGAESYQLFRNGTQVYTGAGLTFSETGLSVGTAYSYSVKATNASGSSELSAAVTGTTLKPIPSNLTVSGPTTSSLSVSWTAETGAISYEAYRDDSATGAFTTKVHDSASSYFNDSGLDSSTTYHYKVRAEYPAGFSDLSTAVSGTTATAVTYSTPTGLTIAYDWATGGAQLTWDTMAGATGYTVYRDTNHAGTFDEVVNSGGSAASYVTPVGTSAVYFYKVTATYPGGTSGKSAEVSSIADASWTSAPLSYPTAKNPTPISYLGNGEYQFGGYTIFAGTYEINAASPFSLTMTVPSNPNYTGFVWDIGTGTGMLLTNSSYAGATMTRQAPLAPTPTGLAATAWTATGATMSWTASSGATEYRVYRDTTSAGAFGTMVYSGASTIYSTSSVPSGTVYYYKVSAVSAGGESSKSAEISSLAGATWKSGPNGSTPTNSGAIAYIGNNTYTVGGATIFNGTYVLDPAASPDTLTMTIPSNPNYSGFIWRVDSLIHLYLTNSGYAGATMAR